MRIFIENTQQYLDFQEDNSKTLLEFLKENHITIKSNCEGNGVCGKCHISFDKETYAKFNDITETELDVLDLSINNTPTSRLACQVKLQSILDGAKIKIIN